MLRPPSAGLCLAESQVILSHTRSSALVTENREDWLLRTVRRLRRARQSRQYAEDIEGIQGYEQRGVCRPG